MAIYLGMFILAFLPVIGALKAFSFLLPSQTGGENIASTVNIVFMFGLDIALVLAGWITLRWIDRRPFALLGMSFSAQGIKELLAGLAFGFLYLTVCFLILRLAGLVDVTAGGMNSQTLESMLRYLVVFSVAGVFEEVVNRGYLLQALIEGTRAWIAILGFSFIFSLVHIFNEDFSWVSGLCLLLQGILFGLAYFRTRSLWVPIGMHVAWNWTQGSLWGMKVSGTETGSSFLVSLPKGPELLSGGSFGAEASLITLAVTACLVLYVWKAKWIRPTQEKSALCRRYPSGFGREPADAKGQSPASTS
ncbi:MAG: CPBP family intramembrane metalloprotease [Candidatus Zixiibacteriota bacterium]|nr:MAG: CPBP family intramembrane metalloprotease [candidate division Zixibacteria bacterium]